MNRKEQAFGLLLAAALVGAHAPPAAAAGPVVWTDEEKPLVEQVRGLRALSDDARTLETKRLALDIRRLPASVNKVKLANSLASLATEGDFGRDALQEAATTLAVALRDWPLPDAGGLPASPYVELATLVRYEGMKASLDDPQFSAAQSRLEADDGLREKADFTLTDLAGKSWSLKKLKGKVVLVNFYASWCPPCRKEAPTLEALQARFRDKGLVILAITDEEAGKAEAFAAQQKISYPLLLDPGRTAHQAFRVDDIPKTFVFDRQGKLAAQSIDMRTEGQFLEMLARAGLQ